MNPSPAAVLWLGRLYFALSIKQKIPRASGRRAVLLPAPTAQE
jgi:hypothetical protein